MTAKPTAVSSDSPAPPSPLRAISLFTGIGGIEVGLEAAGAATVVRLCEKWESARAVLQARFPDVPLDYDVKELRTLDDATLVCAGFPCTDLSQAGRTRGLLGDQSALVLRALELIARDGPDWVLLENVPNMLHLASGHAMTRIVEELEDAGYLWAYRILDSRFTGLAHRRRRVFVLASREQDPALLLFSENLTKDDVADLQEPPHPTAYGFSWTEGNRGLGWTPGGVPTLRGGTTVSVPSPPAVWIPANPPGDQIVRPSAEAAEVLQGFEPGWTAVAPERDRWKLVGNAVSTRAARWIGEQILRRSALGDSLWEEDLLPAGMPWPGAARGGDGKRWRVRVSEYPRRPSRDEQQDLAAILSIHGSEPLSFRASRGFRDRLKRSSLRYQSAFMDSLDAHVASHDERVPRRP